MLAVLIGGGVGSAARFFIDSVVTRGVRRGRGGTNAFPWGITVVNLSGSFVLGLLLGADLVWPAIGAGLLGGYTTFSTASLDTVRLLREKRYVAAAGNAFGTLGIAVILATTGLLLGSFWR
ncbi:CrcB family protein [Leucobacter denitrificans]|uniref:Fluoride-specific ion channel FluC n=2 Tax=Leucobacter denitrificans TaxID=683042 RepID=A0A7G9S7M4_9MICO|nr:CrcB family protein [Leucobacter denitrificans]